MSIKHLNQRQLADRWDVSEASLERWRSDGIGPIFLKLQGRVLYRLEDIEAAKRQAEIEKQQALEKQRKEQEARERAEQERIAAEKAIEEKRAANKAHQKKINNEILSWLVKLGCQEETGKNIIAAIVKGEIKNISINY